MHPRILIVDDEEPLANLLRQSLLLEIPECHVVVAGSGEAALSRLAVENYDLIIADLRMPGFDGLELIKGVRYLDPHVPIVLMTGFGSEEVRREAHALGVSRYVDKPFGMAEFLALVRELLPQ